MTENLADNLMRRVALGDCLKRTAKRIPDKIAIIDGEKQITYKEFNEQANQLSHALMNLGIKKDDKVAYMGLNSITPLVTLFGAVKAGMIYVPINPIMQPSELQYALDHADVNVVVVQDLFLPAIEGVKGELKKLKQIVVAGATSSDDHVEFEKFIDGFPVDEVEVIINDRDPAYFLYTGGTTAFPRAAILSHLSVVMHTYAWGMDIKADKSWVMLNAMPLFHVAQLNGFAIPTIVAGGTNVLLPSFDIEQILKSIDKHKVTGMVLLSPLYSAMLNHPDFDKYDMSSLTMCGYFGAVISEYLLKEGMEKICPNFMLAFGQTEMNPCVTFFKPEDQLRKMNTLGDSCIGVEIAVMDDMGNILPSGEIGEFVYRSPNVTDGYYKDEESNKSAFEFGWFHSGDLGYLDEEGYVCFVDRKKDMIKTGGENVASIEVEKLIYTDARVEEVHVIGLAHERWGEAITAFVQPKADQKITKEEIIALCKSKLAGFKVPKNVLLVDDFPRSGTGKTLKYKLRVSNEGLYS